MAYDYVKNYVVIEICLRIAIYELNQGYQGFDAEASVLRGFDLAQQVLYVHRKVALAGGFLLEQRRALKPVAAFELVADDQAAAVVQQAPDPRVEVPRDVLAAPPSACGAGASSRLFRVARGVRALPSSPGR